MADEYPNWQTANGSAASTWRIARTQARSLPSWGAHAERSGTLFARHDVPLRTKAQAGRLAKSGNDFDEAKAVALYEAGASTKDLGRIFGSSPNTICAAIHRAGVMRTKREAALRRRDVTQRRMPRASEMVGVLTACAACGRSDGLELHHVDADATNNDKGNLIALCWEHHMLVELLVTQALLGLRQRGLLERISA